MAITGNKGEWSEVYTFLKLLGDGNVYAGDENLNRIKDLFYPIVMILREQKEGNINYKLEEQEVVIQTPTGVELLRVLASVFLVEAEQLLRAINSSRHTFAVPDVEEFMHSIYCHSLKAKSTDKTDIRIILHDMRTKMNTEMGFSIKSQLGDNSTLLNAGKTTNFSYRIEGAELTNEDISLINSISTRTKVMDRVKTIEKKGGTLVFDKVDSPVFRTNLSMLDGTLSELIALLLLEQVESGITDLKDLVNVIALRNPFKCDANAAGQFYAYKIKHLLTSVALGMMPGKAWDGKFDANGGYFVVRKDGEIVCYHFYDRNRFEDFLYQNAYLERASTTRHDFGTIVRNEDGLLYFKLNLQIRLR